MKAPRKRVSPNTSKIILTSGERIRILRILNGFTQQTLAEHAGASRASVMLWERGKLPTRRNALALATLLKVNVEYILEGINPPGYASWKPIAPGHPKHLIELAADFDHGIPALFSELGIVFSATGQTSDGKTYWLCGNSPDSNEWRLNYLLTCGRSLESLLSHSITTSLVATAELKTTFSRGCDDVSVIAIQGDLNTINGRNPDCSLLLKSIAIEEKGNDEDFTLARLLTLFGKYISHNKLSENEAITMASYIASEVAMHTGFTNIKISSTELFRTLKYSDDQQHTE